MSEAKEVLFQLYEISGSIILALQALANGNYRDKMAMILVEKLVKSDEFDLLATLSDEGTCRVITSGTKHHIRVMFQDLDILTA